MWYCVTWCNVNMWRIYKIRGVHSRQDQRRNVLISLSLSHLCRCSGVSHQHAGAQTSHPGPPTASVSSSSTVEPTRSRHRYGGDPHLTTSSPEKRTAVWELRQRRRPAALVFIPLCLQACSFRHFYISSSPSLNQCSSISLKEISPLQHPQALFLECEFKLSGDWNLRMSVIMWFLLSVPFVLLCSKWWRCMEVK